ncbi:MAG: hypothetical protein ACLP50_15485 [Solirubrobacteraceae bacterium]
MLRSEAGRSPYDRDFTNLIGELSTQSETFRTKWAAHNVRFHDTGTKIGPGIGAPWQLGGDARTGAHRGDAGHERALLARQPENGDGAHGTSGASLRLSHANPPLPNFSARAPAMGSADRSYERSVGGRVAEPAIRRLQDARGGATERAGNE